MRRDHLFDQFVGDREQRWWSCRGRSRRQGTPHPKRPHEEFKRRIKTQTVLPSADIAAMPFWALLAAGKINMREVDGWQTLSPQTPSVSQLTKLPDQIA